MGFYLVAETHGFPSSDTHQNRPPQRPDTPHATDRASGPSASILGRCRTAVWDVAARQSRRPRRGLGRRLELVRKWAFAPSR